MSRLLAILAMVALLGGAIWYFVHASSAQPMALAPQPGEGSAIPVTVTTARRRPMRRTLDLVGTFRADREAVVSARFPSRIATVLVRAGDPVRRGQPVATLDASDGRAQVEGAQAGVDAALTQLSKAKAGKRARITEMDGKVAEARGALALALSKQRQAELAIALTEGSADSDRERAEAAVRQAEAGLRQADSALAGANDTLRRTKFLYDHGGVARADLEGAQTQADITKAQRDSAAEALAQARAAAKPAAESTRIRRQLGQADLDSARSGVQQAEDGLRSARKARGDAIQLSDRDIEAAKAQVAQARASLAQARAQVGGSTLTSPLDGVVIDAPARSGETAQPGQPVVVVAATARLFLEAAAPARYAAGLRAAQPASVAADTLPDRPLNGAVERVLPTAGADGSLTVRIALPPQRGLTPGTGGRATVELERGDSAIAVPVDALRNEGSATFAYIVAAGRAERRNLVLGSTEGGFVQVVSGIASGDQVIISAPASLQPGAAVQTSGR